MSDPLSRLKVLLQHVEEARAARDAATKVASNDQRQRHNECCIAERVLQIVAALMAPALVEEIERLRKALAWTIERIDEHLDHDSTCWCGEHPNPNYGDCDPCLDRQALEAARVALSKKEGAK